MIQPNEFDPIVIEYEFLKREQEDKIKAEEDEKEKLFTEKTKVKERNDNRMGEAMKTKIMRRADKEK